MAAVMVPNGSGVRLAQAAVLAVLDADPAGLNALLSDATPGELQAAVLYLAQMASGVGPFGRLRAQLIEALQAPAPAV